MYGEVQVLLTTWWPVYTGLEILNFQKATEERQDVTILMTPSVSNLLVYRIDWSCLLLELTFSWYFDPNDREAKHS